MDADEIILNMAKDMALSAVIRLHDADFLLCECGTACYDPTTNNQDCRCECCLATIKAACLLIL